MTARANRDRAKEYLARFLTIVRTFDVNALVKLLDEAEGRGRVQAARPDEETKDALRDVIVDIVQEYVGAPLYAPAAEVMAAAIVREVTTNFRLELADDVTEPERPAPAGAGR